MKKPILLRDIPQDSKIFCEASDGSTYIIFRHLDGIFSYCDTEKGGISHMHNAQELKRREGGDYEILTNQ